LLVSKDSALRLSASLDPRKRAVAAPDSQTVQIAPAPALAVKAAAPAKAAAKAPAKRPRAPKAAKE
jgi:hypothetical protein